MTETEQRAWDIYCEDTARDFDVRDSWEELSEIIQKRYLRLADLNIIEFPAKNSMNNLIHLLIYINSNLNEKELEAFYDKRPTKVDDFLKDNYPAYLIKSLRDTMYGFKFALPQYSKF